MNVVQAPPMAASKFVWTLWDLTCVSAILDTDWTVMEGLAQVRKLHTTARPKIIDGSIIMGHCLLFNFILQRSMNAMMVLISVSISVPTPKAPMSVPVTLATCCWPMAVAVRVSACMLSCCALCQWFCMPLDIDECAANTDGCEQVCQDTPGSYTCSCQPGYTLNRDNRTCTGKL